MASTVPTLYEWLGGAEPLTRLIDRFYQKVPSDPLLASLLAHMPQEHFQHVAAFIREVLGGPADYSANYGGHAAMIRHHLGKGITDEQRKLLLETADELNLPADPEFRSALVAYLEWGSRLAASTPLFPPTPPSKKLPCPPGTGASLEAPTNPKPPNPSQAKKLRCTNALPSQSLTNPCIRPFLTRYAHQAR